MHIEQLAPLYEVNHAKLNVKQEIQFLVFVVAYHAQPYVKWTILLQS